MKAISLFSGAGGDSWGLSSAGIQVVGFVEFEKSAIETHKKMMPFCKLIGTDITQITDEVFQEWEGKVDIIFGGFPCQSFSHGGKKNADDKRGFLYQHFVRAARIIKPRFIIGENVEGLRKRKNSTGELFLDVIGREFKEIGYKLSTPYTFRSEDMGVPQLRRRIIIVGEINKEPPVLDTSVFLGTYTPKYIKDILDDSIAGSLQIKNPDIIREMEKGDINEIKDSIDDIDDRQVDCNLLKCYTQHQPQKPKKDEKRCGFSWSKRCNPNYSEIVNLNGRAKTILCSYGRMPRMFVPIKFNNLYYIRSFSVHELKQLQGFPIEFIFEGNRVKQVNQIGNAVPPPIAKEVGLQLKTLVEKFED